MLILYTQRRPVTDSGKEATSDKGSHPERKVQFFFTFLNGGEGGVKPMFKNYVVNLV